MERLNIQESPGTVVNLTFDTTVLINGSGGEERNINWQSPLLSFDLQRVLLYPHLRDRVMGLFIEARGSAIPFLYRDWSDYKLTVEPKRTKYGSVTHGLLYPLADGTRTEFEIYKKYRVGDCTHYRAISYPDPETLTIYDKNGDLIPGSEWIVNDKKISFNSPPYAGQLNCAGEFDVAVTFGSDDFTYRDKSTKEHALFSLEGLILEEIRVDSLFNIRDEISDNSLPFELCGYFNSQVGLREQTEIVDLRSGYDRRTSRIPKPKWTYNLGKIPLWEDELEYLLCFFRCLKGRGLKWIYYDSTDKEKSTSIPVRFDQDSLSLRSIKKGRYEVDSIKAIEIYETELEIDYSNLYGHFTLLETNAGSLFNYHVYGQNRLGLAGGDVREATPIESATGKSSVYLRYLANPITNKDYYRFISFPSSSATYSGFSFLLNAKPGLSLSGFNSIFINDTAGGTPQMIFKYRRDTQEWNVLGRLFPAQTSLDLEAYSSFTVTVDYPTGNIAVYVNGLLDGFSPGNRPLVFADNLHGDFGTLEKMSIGTIQYWTRPLTAQEIAALHPNGIRRPLRSAVPKDSQVGGNFVGAIPDADGNYARNWGETGFNELVATNPEKPPILEENEIRFFRFDGNHFFRLPISNFVKKANTIAVVFRVSPNHPANQQACFGCMTDVVYTTGGASVELVNNTVFVNRGAGGGGGFRSTNNLDSTGVNIQDHDWHELLFDFANSTVVIDGRAITSAPFVYVRGANGPTRFKAIGVTVGAFNNTFTGDSRRFNGDIAVFASLQTNTFAATPYTTANTPAHKAARLFYQMGFKKSLTFLEPNNPRLLAGDYPI